MIMGYNNVVDNPNSSNLNQLTNQDELSQKCISDEFEKLNSISDDSITLDHSEDITLWEVSIKFITRVHELEIEFPVNYPLDPPCVRFITKIANPNVDLASNEIDPNAFKWSYKSRRSMKKVFEVIQNIISEYEESHTLDTDID